jgi:hypothetical protein
MNELATVSARASRAALLLCTSLALVSAPAFAQTPTPPATSPVVAATVAAPTAIGAAQATTAAAVAVTSILPAAPLILPASTLRPTGSTLQAPAIGETAITLDITTGIRAVPPSRLTVPAGETLLITGPNFGGRAVQWMKDGRPLPGATGPLLALQNVRATDAGIYQLVPAETSSSSAPSQFLVLGVGPTDRLVNLSIRGTLAAGPGQNFTAGFVVNGGASQTKKLILRAIGPTLASFGVAGPLRAPVLRIYDSSGNIYSNGYAYLPVVGGLTYEADLAGSLASTGAFPVAAGTLDAVVMMPFLPGAYTAQVTSGDNTAGTVLLEIYEVP